MSTMRLIIATVDHIFFSLSLQFKRPSEDWGTSMHISQSNCEGRIMQKTVWAFNKIDPSPLGRKERKQISNVRWNPPRVIIINKSWNESSIFTKEWARSSVLCTEPVCDCRFFELVIVLERFRLLALESEKKKTCLSCGGSYDDGFGLLFSHNFE